MRDGLSQVYLKTCISLDLERSDFDRQSFQYTWLNSYLLFSSIRESLSFAQAYSTWLSFSSFDKSNRLYSITCWRLRYLNSFTPPAWLESIPISLCKTVTPREAVTSWIYFNHFTSGSSSSKVSSTMDSVMISYQ